MICVDACLVIKAITDEEGSKEALKLFKKWKSKGLTLLAPSLIDYEIMSVLCRKAALTDIQDSDAIQAYQLSQDLGILKKHIPELLDKALLIARSFHQKSAYDFAYLVFAQQQGAELYTTDKKFVDLVQTGFPFVQFYR